MKAKEVHYYEINQAKDYNINTTVSLVEAKRDVKNQVVSIATFSGGPAAELLLDSIEKGPIVVKLIDDVKYTCYRLLDQKPLFESAVNNKISALIIGCDYTGTEMLKAILWCGQITGYVTEINVIDRFAEEREKQLRLGCPDIDFEAYNIHFHVADVRSCDFEDTLDCHCREANYIVVATGDDKINIDTAIYLRKYFLRNDRTHFHNKPMINLRVRDGLKNRHMDALCDANIESYGLNAFGSIEKMFSVDNLLNSSLEKLSLGVHLAYAGALNGTEEQQTMAVRSYYSSEYNQRSSLAAALHIKYKLFACGIRGISGTDVTERQINDYESFIHDPGQLELLAQMEHDRWIAFMRTEGYSKANINDVRVYYSLGKVLSHIHFLAKLHPALAPWGELDSLSKQVSDVMGKSIEFKEYDYDIVRLIPDIIKYSL